jgi:acyl-phosphate glycerol 3-phosphate acyltransferase
MSSDLALGSILFATYLVGAIPFGYLVGRSRGVDLFKAGSGNIGATNAARVLGIPFGVLVFVLDFLKGAVPTACIVPVVEQVAPGAIAEFGSREGLRVSAAALAFLGHLFPIYLGFRGGKGIATGAGTMFVLVPGPTALALLFWLVSLFAWRTVSFASLVAVSALLVSWLMGTPRPFSAGPLPATLYLAAATAMVVLKHRGNIRRLLTGTESRFGDFAMRQTLLRVLHVLALGFWFGGAGFFNFLAAPPIFASFKQVVQSGPSDRTAYETIIPADASRERQDALASALAGSAVGPVFPRYFAMQAVCGAIALLTASSWWNSPGRIHRWRVVVIGVALATVAIGWPISNEVSALRLQRFAPAQATAAAAREAFASWHLVSLFLSFVTVCLAGTALALAAKLPVDQPVRQERAESEPKVLV